MDLACALEAEIKKLNLTDELSIARYIYIRTGELFDYSLAYLTTDYSNPIEVKRSDEIKYQKIDIHHVLDFNLVCTSWAYLYVDLLTYFNIKAEVIDSNYHGYALVYIGNYEITADMMIGYKDIRNIKFGYAPENFIIMSNLEAYKRIFEIDKKIKFFKGINPAEVIHKISGELQEIKDCQERLTKMIKAVTLIMNINRPNITFFSGFKYLKKLMLYFTGSLNLDANLNFKGYFNENFTTFLGFITCIYNNETRYLVYKQDELGFYKLDYVANDYLKTLNNKYSRQRKM